MGKKSAEPHAELLEAVVALLRCAPRLETVDEADLVEEEAFGEDVFSIGSGSDQDRDRELFGGRASRRGERSNDSFSKDDKTAGPIPPSGQMGQTRDPGSWRP